MLTIAQIKVDGYQNLREKSNNNHENSTQEELENISTVFWKCVGFQPNPHGQGKQWVFNLREQFQLSLDERWNNPEKCKKVENAIQNELLKIFPAVEPAAMDAIGISQRKNSYISMLGYSCGNIDEAYLTVPDVEMLRTNWKILQIDNLDLPNLDICDSNGIASDEEFIEACLNHDIVLSNGKELIHDSLSHVLPRIRFINETKSQYQEAKKNFNTLVRNSLQMIRNCEKNGSLNSEIVRTAKKLLGIFCDIATSQNNLRDFTNQINLFKDVKLFFNERVLPSAQYIYYLKMQDIIKGGDSHYTSILANYFGEIWNKVKDQAKEGNS